MKKLALVVALATLSFRALAADSAAPHDEAPAPPPTPLWAGFYLGFNRGFGAGEVDGNAAATSFFPAVGNVTLTSDQASGFFVGGQAGYNYRFANRFILGLETDFQWSDVKASHQARTVSTVPFLATNTDVHTGINWFGTSRARLGYSVGRLMPFVSGGVAYGEVASSGVQILGSGLLTMGSRTDTRIGWALGGGVEFALTNNLNAKAEYLYLMLPGAGGSTGGFMTAALLPSAGSFGMNSLEVHMFRSGLNYRFEKLSDLTALMDGSALSAIAASPAYDWSGYYVGVNSGYGGGVVSGTTSFVQAGLPGLAETTTTSNRTGGFVAGAQFGYNRQFSNDIVVGVETDAQWTGIKAWHQASSAGAPLGLVYTDTINGLTWFGTTRARLGYATGNALTYVTGGVAYGEIYTSGVQISGGLFAGATTQIKVGWTLGAGAEYALTSDLSLRSEYLYASLGGVSGPGFGLAPPPLPALVGSFSTGEFGSNIVRLGLNWKLSGLGISKDLFKQ